MDVNQIAPHPSPFQQPPPPHTQHTSKTKSDKPFLSPALPFPPRKTHLKPVNQELAQQTKLPLAVLCRPFARPEEGEVRANSCILPALYGHKYVYNEPIDASICQPYISYTPPHDTTAHQPKQAPVPSVDYGDAGPMRCTRCKAYVSCFATWLDNGCKCVPQDRKLPPPSPHLLCAMTSTPPPQQH